MTPFMGVLSNGSSISPRVASPVYQQALAGYESGMIRAQECAIGAELGRPAVAPGRIGARPLAPDIVERFAARIEHGLDVPALRIAVKNSRQQIVDRDVMRDR